MLNNKLLSFCTDEMLEEEQNNRKFFIFYCVRPMQGYQNRKTLGPIPLFIAFSQESNYY
jgi:hypothetical protein